MGRKNVAVPVAGLVVAGQGDSATRRVKAGPCRMPNKGLGMMARLGNTATLEGSDSLTPEGGSGGA